MIDPERTAGIEGQAYRQRRRLRFEGELERAFRAAHLQHARERTRLWNGIECLAPPVIALLLFRCTSRPAARSS